MPIFGDQPANAYEAQHRGYGIAIPLPDLTSDKLYHAVNEVLTNASYASTAQTYGRMVMDQMTSPLERAVWWMEYALRYPGMKHMKSPVHDLHWTQYFLLDILAFFIVLLGLLGAIVFNLCRCCFRMCGRKIKQD